MRFFNLILPLSVFLLSVCAAPTLAQDRIDLDEVCSYYGEEVSDDMYAFASDDDAKSAVARIMKHSGLPSNFEIRAANVPNASAAIRGSNRLILYNQQFMDRVTSATSTDWAAISIMAHEIGHHLSGHTLQAGGSRPSIELEADVFSGHVLAQMGATLDEAQAAMRALGSDSGSSTHPPKSARLAAIANGWYGSAGERTSGAGERTGGAGERSEPTGAGRSTPSTTTAPPTTPPMPPPSTTDGSITSPRGTSSDTAARVARVVFPSDPLAYYVLSNNVIVAANPVTGQQTPVGRRTPATESPFVWMYSLPNLSYGVDTNGAVWARDPRTGNPFQIGYVTGPQ